MNSCYLCHLHSCVLSLTCFCQIHLQFLYLFHLFWKPTSWIWKSPAFRSLVRTFSVVYESFPMVWRCLCCCCLSAVGRRASCIWVKVRSRLTPHYVTRHLLTQFVLKYFAFLLPFFSIEISTENNIHRSQILHLFYLVRCWYKVTFL